MNCLQLLIFPYYFIDISICFRDCFSIGPNAAMHGNTKILVNSTGNVLWVPPVQYKIQCRPDMSHWPYDTQTGLLKVGSWVYSDNDLNLINTTHEVCDLYSIIFSLFFFEVKYVVPISFLDRSPQPQSGMAYITRF